MPNRASGKGEGESLPRCASPCVEQSLRRGGAPSKPVCVNVVDDIRSSPTGFGALEGPTGGRAERRFVLLWPVSVLSPGVRGIRASVRPG